MNKNNYIWDIGKNEKLLTTVRNFPLKKMNAPDQTQGQTCFLTAHFKKTLELLSEGKLDPLYEREIRHSLSRYLKEYAGVAEYLFLRLERERCGGCNAAYRKETADYQ